jgi:hypothetical protein
MNARFSIANHPVARIAALPVNAAHRASARADYLAAERSVERIFTLLANIRALVVACRSAFGLRERSGCGRRRSNIRRLERRKLIFRRGRCRG